jgi:hypothetical protein
MHREIYTHQTLAALQRTQQPNRRSAHRRALAAARGERTWLRRSAHLAGSLLISLGARLHAYGANRPDARPNADLRYS